MNTDELKSKINHAGESAFSLLLDKVPTANTRFNRLTNNLATLLNEVREHFPEARYYTSGGDGFALVLGDTHSGAAESPNNELVALSAGKLTVQGGDW